MSLSVGFGLVASRPAALHDLPALAVAALGHVQRAPRLLDSLPDGRRADALDGRDLLARRRTIPVSRTSGWACRPPDGAGAAERHAAAELWCRSGRPRRAMPTGSGMSAGTSTFSTLPLMFSVTMCCSPLRGGPRWLSVSASDLAVGTPAWPLGLASIEDSAQESASPLGVCRTSGFCEEEPFYQSRVVADPDQGRVDTFHPAKLV